MLTEILCEKFKEKSITFHSGLNVVLGDSVATNSIGKSTLLMVIDFVLGGESFLDHNKDVVRELGNHDYLFSFEFGTENIYFKRGTYKPDLVYSCNKDYQEIEPISIEDYRSILKSLYALENIELSFRSIVSLFSRVWGKENLDVKHPLHSFKQQNSSECITNTIKLFNKYGPIKTLSQNVKVKGDENKNIGKAFKDGLISKTSKIQYKNNLATVTSIKDEVEDIKNNLKKYTVNISEIVNREIMDLKTDKDHLLSEKMSVDSRLLRVKNDLQSNKGIKSKHLSPLLKYFPDVNITKLEEVELFHSKLTNILRVELKTSETELLLILEDITCEIKSIDDKIATTITNIENPNVIVDRVYGLSQEHSVAAKEIEYFETDVQIKSDLKDAKKLLADAKTKILKLVEDAINNKNRKNVTAVYSEERRNPVLSLSQNNYSFEVVEDTGTGKAYSNLILLDLAFLETTIIPFLIHDSVLFKNIQNDAIARLIDLYEITGKQIFIAIDEVEKYGEKAEAKLKGKKVISLDNDNVLYIKDWRK